MKPELAMKDKETRYNYSPFGITEMLGEASDNPFKYIGREDDGTGLYYYRARYYSPMMGRFISEAPIRFAGGMNWYAYVGNNPVKFVDPLGLMNFGKIFTGGLMMGQGLVMAVFGGLVMDTGYAEAAGASVAGPFAPVLVIGGAHTVTVGIGIASMGALEMGAGAAIIKEGLNEEDTKHTSCPDRAY